MMLAVRSQKAHFNLWLQQAILRVAAYLEAAGGEDVLAHYGFLEPHLAPMREQFAEAPSLPALDRRWQALVVDVDGALAGTAGYPLLRLRGGGLTATHLFALMLVGLVELDARFGTVYSVLHPFPDELRLTVGLLQELLRFGRRGDGPSGWALVRELAQHGLVTVHRREQPRAARPLTVSAPVWDVLCGQAAGSDVPYLRHRPQGDLATLDDLSGLLPESLLGRLARLPQLAAQGLAEGLILRGMRGSGQLRALGAVARLLERDLLHLEQPPLQQLPELCQLAGTLALLQRALPVIELELAPGDTVTLPSLGGYQGLFGVALSRAGRLSGPRAERCLTLSVPAPGPRSRQKQWQHALNGSVNGNQAVIDAVSRRYHLTLGAAAQTGHLARAYAALNDHAHVQVTDVQEAYRALNQRTLENLATRLEVGGSWADLIVSHGTRAELENLILRCRHREAVLAHLGRGFVGTTRGVRALFSGASGTGKTLAARIVAADLGLDLYRVDLSAVVSKYIGETERNLSRLFARAEEQDVILLLDEGDSLLTARTDVRNANDRYANLETNYLLQRLEHYEGIILITTNAADRIDGAFQRRIDIFVEFTVPDAGQRRRLWQLHLPPAHGVSESFLQRAALRCQLTGGQIRNAALHATVLALESEGVLCDEHLAQGIGREYTKMGAASPLN